MYFMTGKMTATSSLRFCMRTANLASLSHWHSHQLLSLSATISITHWHSITNRLTLSSDIQSRALPRWVHCRHWHVMYDTWIHRADNRLVTVTTDVNIRWAWMYCYKHKGGILEQFFCCFVHHDTCILTPVMALLGQFLLYTGDFWVSN